MVTKDILKKNCFIYRQNSLMFFSSRAERSLVIEIMITGYTTILKFYKLYLNCIG